MSGVAIALVVVASLWVGGALVTGLIEQKGRRLDASLTVLVWPIFLFGSVLVVLADRKFVWGKSATVREVWPRIQGYRWQSLCGTARWNLVLISRPKGGSDD